MILLTRLNGTQFALNADLIEKVEAKPDTLVTLVDSSVYVVADTLGEVIDMVIDFRAAVVSRSVGPESTADPTPLRVVAARELGGGQETSDGPIPEEVD